MDLDTVEQLLMKLFRHPRLYLSGSFEDGTFCICEQNYSDMSIICEAKTLPELLVKFREFEANYQEEIAP